MKRKMLGPTLSSAGLLSLVFINGCVNSEDYAQKCELGCPQIYSDIPKRKLLGMILLVLIMARNNCLG
ncbi:hypothetical protein AAEX28_00695 [Lentisphaerota bacterium WC36G]|nr:hypothetical protein LJT99_03575 [Lentisphaerae bacterium WC36]